MAFIGNSVQSVPLQLSEQTQFYNLTHLVLIPLN